MKWKEGDALGELVSHQAKSTQKFQTAISLSNTSQALIRKREKLSLLIRSHLYLR